MGRKLAPIDWARANKLMEAGCTGKEVAANFGIDKQTFYRRVEQEYKIDYNTYLHLKRDKGDSMLRAKQVEVAMSGDKTMLIWLGKQKLNQREPEAVERKPENKDGFNKWLKQVKTVDNAV